MFHWIEAIDSIGALFIDYRFQNTDELLTTLSNAKSLSILEFLIWYDPF